MAKSSKGSSNSNYDKYLTNLKHRGYDKLPIPDHEESLDEIIAEGEKLLLEDEAKKKKQTVSSPSVASKSPPKPVSPENPYLKARNQTLKDYGEKKAKMILKMEAEKDVDNDIYTCFYQRVMELGDKLSNN